MVFVGLMRPTLLFFLCFFHSPMVLWASDIEALLKLKESFKDAKELDSWNPDTLPCNETNPWTGVICYKGIVYGLRLGDMGLSGNIDIVALQEIGGLRSISFMNNSFTGPIPEFNRLGALKALYLSDNAFLGGIKEDYFLKMESLKKLWMSDNKFTGPIPISLAKLTNLKELHLEGNQFSGPIPPLPALTSLNFSNNNLEGQIPTGLSKFNASSFLGNAGLCGKPLSVECKVVPPTAPPESAQLPEQAPPSLKDEASVTAAIVTLVLVILTLAVATIIVVKRRREFDVLGGDSFHEPIELHMPPPASTSKEVESATISNRGITSSRKGSQSGKGAGAGAGDLIVVNEERGLFDLPDLMKAAAEMLGNGSLGSAYKAVMTNGVAVVVKRMRDMNKLGKDGFDMELRRLGGLHHRNILTPLAYHYRKEEKLVVNEIRSHQKEQTGQRFERYPMSPSLLHNRGYVGNFDKENLGYELRTNAGGCNRLLCWKKN